MPSGPNVRDDSGVYSGYTVPTMYDPMISKVSVWAPSRPEAIARMRRALAEYVVKGITTNIRYLHAILAHPDFIGGNYDTGTVDWVDPETGEVRRVDGLWHSLQSCCSHKPEFYSSEVSLATAIFRLFLANGNQPMSPMEIWQKLPRRDPKTILRLLTESRSYYGVRPVSEAA